MENKSFRHKAVTFLMIVFALTTIYPIVWMGLNSFKTATEVIADPIGLPRHFDFDNYAQVFHDIPFLRYFLNSMIYTAGTIVLVLAIAAPFAYATSRMDLKWGQLVYRYVQFGLVTPIAIIVLALYIQLGQMGLRSTYLGTILVYTASALPVSILLLYAFMRSLPTELEEAAYIDGCGTFQAFVKIILPMVMSAISAVAIIVFMQYTWNEYFIAFITIDSTKMQSIPVALGYFSTSRGTNWGVLCAALVMSGIPSILLYLFMSEKIEYALTVSAALK